MNVEKKRFFVEGWEFIVPFLLSVSLLVSCALISRGKYFWNDEFLSYYLLDDRSFYGMMSALGDTINNCPPLYFILGWFWSKVFGSSELSLRLFSSVGMCFAQAIVWICLRRYYGFWAASFGTAIGFLSYQLMVQNSEARFYGLLMAVSSLGLFQFIGFCQQERLSSRILLGNIIIQILIVQTHLYGFLYSGITLLALIIRDKYFRVWRLKAYGSFLVAWLSFIAYLPLFIRQVSLGTWMSVPGIGLLFRAYSELLISPKPRAIFLLFAFGIFAGSLGLKQYRKTRRSAKNTGRKNIILDRDRSAEEASIEVRTSLTILAICFLLAPIPAWLISQIKPVFLYRYLLPTQIGWSILLASLIHHYLRSSSGSRGEIRGKIPYRSWMDTPRKLFASVVLSSILVFPIYGSYHFFPRENRPGALDDRYGYTDLPIVVESAHEFLRRAHYSPRENRYFFILNRASESEQTGKVIEGEKFTYKTMDALRRHYSAIFRETIVQSQDFLRERARFLICLAPEPDLFWYQNRIQDNPAYRVRTLGKIDRETLLLVETVNSKANKPFGI